MRTIWSIVATITVALMVMAMVPFSMAQDGAAVIGQSAGPLSDKFGMDAGNQTNVSTDQADIAQNLTTVANAVFYGLNETNGTVRGVPGYLYFEVDPATGSISNYSLQVGGRNATIINHLTVEGWSNPEWSVAGPLFTASSGDVSMALHNNMVGTVHIASGADGQVVNMTLPFGTQASPMQTENESMAAWALSDAAGGQWLLIVKNGEVSTDLPGAVTAENQTGGNQTTVPSDDQTGQEPTGDTSQRIISTSLFQDENTTNRTENQTGQAVSGSFLEITLNGGGEVLLRYANDPGFNPADTMTLAGFMANGQVVTETSILVANNTLYWCTVDMGTVSTEVAREDGNISATLSGLPTDGAETPAANETENETANQTTAVGPVSYAIMNLDRSLMVQGQMSVMLDDEQLQQAGSLATLNTTGGYVVIQGGMFNKLVVAIPEGNASATITIGGLSLPGNASAMSPSTTAMAGFEAVAGIGLVALLAITAAVFILRRK